MPIPDSSHRSVAKPHPSCPVRTLWLCLLLAAGVSLHSGEARAQNEVEDLFQGFGTAQAVEEDSEAPEEGTGSLEGVVVDQATGIPLGDVTVIITLQGGDGRQDIRQTDVEGYFEFAATASGSYKIDFVKAGYRASSMIDFVVEEGEVNTANFPMPPQSTGSASGVLDLEAFVVEASQVGELMNALELRLEGDQLLNIMSAEDLSRFAASDVADALKRVAGVNVVEGQFAIIRGLEDRYSSTLYNGAVVPSPDPDRQSVQLDLFPSDVVNNLVVAKTFGAALPSNSSGGSINIVTHDYPDAITLKLSVGSGFSERTLDRFIRLNAPNPIGVEENPSHTIETDFTGSLAGTTEWLDREFRFKFVAQNEIDFETRQGFQETREPSLCYTRFLNECDFDTPLSQIFYSGDLAFGELSLTHGRFDFTESRRTEQTSYYAGLGLDLDEEGKHRIDGSYYFTRKDTEIQQFRENAFIQDRKTRPLSAFSSGRFAVPAFDYATVQDEQLNQASTFNCPSGSDGIGRCISALSPLAWIGGLVAGAQNLPNPTAAEGTYIGTLFSQSQTFETERELWIAQIGGEHDLDFLDGLELSWTYNHAESDQDEESRRARLFFHPDGDEADVAAFFDRRGLPARGPFDPAEGDWAISNSANISSNVINETQDFARADLEYETEIHEDIDLKVTTGGWYEKAERDVSADFLIQATRGGAATTTFAFLGETPLEAGELFARELGGVVSSQTNDSLREIFAYAVDVKATFRDKVDLVAGLRVEDIHIESNNDPFLRDPVTGEVYDSRNPTIINDPVSGETYNVRFNAPGLFPSLYIHFDPRDNPYERVRIEDALDRNGPISLSRERTFNQEPRSNLEILGLDLPTQPCNRFQEPDGPPSEEQCVDFVSLAEIDDIINGEIDETFLLPAVSLAVRPIEGLSVRGAFSQTVARPSFREMGFYLSVEPGSDDQIVGNPQLQLSEVTSYDARIEYSWGDVGDLFAVSGFYKDIQDPIESVVIRDLFVPENTSAALFRTFLNNKNDAALWGIELEMRKTLDFIEFLPFLEYFSVGGNYTYIDAEVQRSDVELQRAAPFFQASEADQGQVLFTGLNSKRRLFGQPEWIANADLRFEQPDWGTDVTLAWFAISDVLDAAGTAFVRGNGDPIAASLDRYVGSFQQLDLVVSQQLWGGVAFKMSIKNLTDSTRKLIYDPAQTNREIAERSFKVGRDYSFALTWTREF